jgi:hypothetical protein
MGDAIEIIGWVIGWIAAAGFVACWLIVFVNVLRMIRLQRVFSEALRNPLCMFSISDGLQGEAFGEAGRGPRKWALWGFIGTIVSWIVGFGVLALTQP